MRMYYLLIIKNVVSDGCGPTDGGIYDLSGACLRCGTGGRRAEPIRLARSLLSQRLIATLYGEIVLPPRLVDRVRPIAPQCLREIRDVDSGDVLAHCELVPELVLPPWGARTRGWEFSRMDPPCPSCGRDGRYNIPHMKLEIFYTGKLPEFHFASTYEGFGRSVRRSDLAQCNFAKSQSIISEQIKEALSHERGLEFVEVTED